MDWTGQLYRFYTNQTIEKVFQLLKAHAAVLGFKCECNEWQDEHGLLFYKSNEMYELHFGIGYNTELEGEGCFGIEAKTASIDAIATLIEFEGERDFEQYEIQLALSNISYFTVVVPDVIETCVFSRRIVEMFRTVLRSNPIDQQ